jgi:hypothetical protein
MKKVQPDNPFYQEKERSSYYIYSLWDHDTQECLVIGGFTMMNQTTCVVWYDISPVGYTRIKDVYRVLKEWSLGYKKEDGTWEPGFYEHLGIKRAEGYIRPDDEGAKIWILKHKFKYEYTAKNYYGDEDADLYVRYFDWSKK